MINKERAVQKFMEIVQIDSVSLNERNIADWLLNHFSSLGYDAVEDLKSNKAVPQSNSGNVIVKIPGNGDKATLAPIILQAHMDTVEPGNGIKPHITEDGRYVVSDGTTILGADDKAGIAQILEIVEIIRSHDISHPPLELLFTIGEEVGLFGAFNVDTSLLEGKQAYVLDGGGEPGTAIIGGPDYFDIEGRIIGKAAHAGAHPDQGISSIQVMAHAISTMNLLKIDEDTTTNIGRVICDYPTNVVPEVTTFEMEVRSLDSDKAKKQCQHVIDALETACEQFGATLEYSMSQSIAAYKHDDDHPVLKRYIDMCEKHNLPYRGLVMRGGTDVSGLMANGIDAIALTAGGEYAHELRERLNIETFVNCIQQVLWLITD